MGKYFNTGKLVTEMIKQEKTTLQLSLDADLGTTTISELIANKRDGLSIKNLRKLEIALGLQKGDLLL